jgi:hypothetical protein
MRGKSKRIVTALFLAVIFLMANVKAVYAEGEEKLKITHSYGFESAYKAGSLVPVTVEIDNNLKDIDGEIQLEIPVNNMDMDGSQSDSVTIYAQGVNLPRGTKKKVTLNVPIARNVTSIKVNVTEGRNTLITKEISLGAALNPNDFIIGVLSDDFNSVSYINRVAVDSPMMGGKRSYQSKLVKMDENMVPEDLNVFKNINVIIINNFDTSKLKPAKYEALKKWVEQGGTLLMGTGPSYGKTVSVFKDNFLSAEIIGEASIDTSALNKLLDNKSDRTMKLEVINVNMKDTEAIIKDGDRTLVHKLEKGKGVVALAAFDFGLSPLSSWSLNSTFGEALLGKVLPAYYLDSTYDRITYGGYKNNLSYTLSNIPELPVPKASHLIIIFFLYIAIVAPANYIILKKKDKREYMWFTVPVLSILFAGIVYFAGARTRVTRPVLNVLSTIEIDNKGNQLFESYGAVITPSKSNIRIEAEEGMSLRPLSNLEYYGKPMNPGGNANSSLSKVYSKVVQAPKAYMEYYDTAVFGQYSFIIDTGEVRKGTLQAEVSFKDNKLIGAIKNNTGLDLDRCFVITPTSFVTVGEIKNGQVKNIDEPINVHNGMGYELVNSMFGINYGYNPNSSAEEIRERKIAEQMRGIIQSYFESSNMRVMDNIIMAITETPVTKDIIVNSAPVKRYGRTLVTSKFKISYVNGSSAEFPLGSIRPVVSAANGHLKYDDMHGIIHGDSGEVEIRYAMDKAITPKKIEIKATPDISFKGMPVIQGKGYIMNVEKEDWEEFDYKDFSIDEDKISKYVNKDNVLLIKIDTTGMRDVGTVPQIYMKGSVK